jgi:hypothetical protein
MAKVLYTAEATVTGGRAAGHGHSTEAKRLVAAAHGVCPYSNATRGNIDVTLTASGQAV